MKFYQLLSFLLLFLISCNSNNSEDKEAAKTEEKVSAQEVVEKEIEISSNSLIF